MGLFARYYRVDCAGKFGFDPVCLYSQVLSDHRAGKLEANMLKRMPADAEPVEQGEFGPKIWIKTNDRFGSITVLYNGAKYKCPDLRYTVSGLRAGHIVQAEIFHGHLELFSISGNVSLAPLEYEKV